MNELGFGMLATLLILVGATIGAVLTYLANRSRHTSRLTLDLIQCNERCRFDALDFLNAAWPILSEAGFNGLLWQTDWYGAVKKGSVGLAKGTSVQRVLEASEIKLMITLTLPTVRGEDRYFREALAATFFLLLQCDLWVKVGSVSAAAAELSRFALFLRHDMKNYAQYIELLDDQVRACNAEQAASLLERLQRTTPILRDRTAAMLQALQGHNSPSMQSQITQLTPFIQKTAAIHGLNCQIRDNGYSTTTPETVLDTVFDNLFKNYADLALRKNSPPPCLTIDICLQEDKLVIRIADPEADAAPHLERFFEPFWTDHPKGMGIGLYQARQTLLANNGSFGVKVAENGGPLFTLTLPHSQFV